MKTGGAHFSFVVARSFTADGNLLQPTGGCEQKNTLTRHIFSCLSALITVSHVTLAQGVVRIMPSMFHALVFELFPLCLFSGDGFSDVLTAYGSFVLRFWWFFFHLLCRVGLSESFSGFQVAHCS